MLRMSGIHGKVSRYDCRGLEVQGWMGCVGPRRLCARTRLGSASGTRTATTSSSSSRPYKVAPHALAAHRKRPLLAVAACAVSGFITVSGSRRRVGVAGRRESQVGGIACGCHASFVNQTMHIDTHRAPNKLCVECAFSSAQVAVARSPPPLGFAAACNGRRWWFRQQGSGAWNRVECLRHCKRR
jgi:hypothetical protein